MSNLHSFPHPNDEEDIKIIARASVKFRQIGTMLLKDKRGNKVANIQSKTNNNEDAMHEIFCQWLREEMQCSWEKLIQCLQKCDCETLASEIEYALRKAQKGIIYILFLTCYYNKVIFNADDGRVISETTQQVQRLAIMDGEDP